MSKDNPVLSIIEGVHVKKAIHVKEEKEEKERRGTGTGAIARVETRNDLDIRQLKKLHILNDFYPLLFFII